MQAGRLACFTRAARLRLVRPLTLCDQVTNGSSNKFVYTYGSQARSGQGGIFPPSASCQHALVAPAYRWPGLGDRRQRGNYLESDLGQTVRGRR